MKTHDCQCFNGSAHSGGAGSSALSSGSTFAAPLPIGPRTAPARSQPARWPSQCAVSVFRRATAPIDYSSSGSNSTYDKGEESPADSKSGAPSLDNCAASFIAEKCLPWVPEKRASDRAHRVATTVSPIISKYSNGAASDRPRRKKNTNRPSRSFSDRENVFSMLGKLPLCIVRIV